MTLGQDQHRAPRGAARCCGPANNEWGKVTDARAEAPCCPGRLEGISAGGDSPHKMALCACACVHVCTHNSALTAPTSSAVCFSNANLTRGLCVAATARPTSTTASCIEMPASLDPKSRSITMDTAKVKSALITTSQLQLGSHGTEQCLASWSPFHPEHSAQSCGDHPVAWRGTPLVLMSLLGLPWVAQASALCFLHQIPNVAFSAVWRWIVDREPHQQSIIW